mmetsp:Transcript_29989/g.83821  ORF Transcript_29989/g.83821 Transcript_29989/m.83821 type:complete len:99 (-) Transcript_29989:14-310(-)
MGLLGLVIDSVVLTTAVAGVRRVVGLDLGQMVLKRIKNPSARRGVMGYLELGEYCADKSIALMGRMSQRLETSHKERRQIGKWDDERDDEDGFRKRRK